MRSLGSIAQKLVPALLALVVVAPVTMWAMDTDAPTDLVSVEIMTPRVPPGGFFEAEFKVDRQRNDCDTMALRSIIDGKNVLHVIENVIVPTGPLGPDTIRVRLKVPDSAAIGDARYRVTTYFTCNPLHKLLPRRGTFPDRPFKIVSSNEILMEQLSR